MAQINPPSFAHDQPLKRKRSRSLSAHLESSNARFYSSSPAPLSDAINPLSYTPSTLGQLRAAGHSDADFLPATSVPDFPHRPLPREQPRHGSPPPGPGDEDGDDNNDDAAAAKKSHRLERAHAATERHLGVLTALIHRSLEEGDLPRAKRAFGLLVRSELRGAAVDLRQNGYWGIGAEILMREGERFRRNDDDDDADENNNDDEDGNDEDAALVPRRWGRAANMPAVRDYFHALIHQYPYNKFYPRAVSALTLWPALLGCELYNTWAEQSRALARLDGDWRRRRRRGSGAPYGDDEGDEAQRRGARDTIRLDALGHMRHVARSMDDLMTAPPYSNSHELLRLRGMVALYMADLAVPPRPRSEAEEHEAAVQRSAEMDRARNRFARVLQDGGELEGWICSFVTPQEDDDEPKESPHLRSSSVDLPFFSSLPIRNRYA